MKHRAERRIAAAIIMLCIVVAGFTCQGSLAAVGWNLFGDTSHSDLSTGRSGSGAVGDSNPPLGDSDPTLGESQMKAARDAEIHYIETEDELERHLKDGHASCTIYFLQDIYLTKYIEIPAGKTVVLDGQNHNLVESATSSVIFMQANDGTRVTLQNMTIKGYNHFGPVRGINSGSKRSHLFYDGITYNGPQLTEAKNGEVTINNSTINIVNPNQAHSPTAGNVPQEVVEAAVLTLGGNVVINHLVGSSYISDSLFWADRSSTGTAGIFVEPGANVRITGQSYLYFADNSLHDVFQIGAGAYVSIDIAGGQRLNNSNHAFEEILIGDGATLIFNQTRPPSHAANNGCRYLVVNGMLSMGQDSVFLVTTDDTDTGLHLMGGTQVVMNSPRVFSVYNKTKALNSNGNVSWNITGINTMNYWKTHPALNDPSFDKNTSVPDYIFHYIRESDTEKHLGGAFDLSINTGGLVTGPSVPEQVEGDEALDSAGLNIRGTVAKRIAWGNYAFSLRDTPLSDYEITGSVTYPAALRADYTSVEEQREVLDADASSDAAYSLTYTDETLPLGGTPARVMANHYGLRAILSNEYTGEVTLIRIPTLYYGLHEVPTEKTVYPREGGEPGNVDMHVIVKDTRGSTGDGWDLLVRSSQPFTGDDGHVISDALVFVSESGVQKPITGVDYAIYTFGKDRPYQVTHDLVWLPDQGIVAEVSLGDALPGDYEAGLIWSVLSAP